MMNVKLIRGCWLGCMMLLVFMAPLASTQTKNSSAIRWFNKGVREKDDTKRIEAYEKAIEYDPHFVEALYNLGLVYKRKQDYPKAEQFLLRAANAWSDKTKTELKFQILRDLALTYRRGEKFKDSEATLLRARQLALSPEMRARIDFELGRLLYEQGRYQEAISELNKGKTATLENRELFTNLIKLAEEAIALQQLYETAEQQRASGKLREAKSLFEHVKAKNPGFKDVVTRIAELDSLLRAQEEASSLAASFERAQKLAAEGNLQQAVLAYESILQRAGDYQDARARLQGLRDQLKQAERLSELEREYLAGMAALDARDWTKAIVAFEKVRDSDRRFRDVGERLAQAKSGLARESAANVTARYYAEGIDALNRNDLTTALVALQEVYKIDPTYREVAALLESVESALLQQPATNPPPGAESGFGSVMPLVDSLYQSAMALIDQKDWMQAVVTLEKINVLQPNYHDVVDHLAHARAMLKTSGSESAERNARAERSSSLFVGGLITAVVLVPLLGFMVFSPITRARIYLFLGNYAAAMRIYENMLTRRPDHLKLFPGLAAALANYYLLSGRRDERAMQVYKMVLQSNLETDRREDIQSIVTQQYLAEGKKESDAIRMLEDSLKVEDDNQTRGPAMEGTV